ncbi:FO synthase subunit 1 /FO synthase subunit 2 [Pseudonocardia ammonioxydans]|uniref:FO synthase n=1 Tax=Pseudonocardia ammonioxydans TaxID=260086 RepID=A0A1I4WB93_PSUAM|nr:bifunctional FO biosynthesis protein CofGH [Pseudonocardia ammonioxydans]SFN10500.1 FO synthase subunit 1 /FO synthase subunit 2 [Pseudonocardia ammonioxydans]
MAESSAAPSEPAPSASALRRALRRVRDGSTLDVTEAAVLLAARGADLDELLTHASRVRDAGLVEEGRPGVITYSRNVFIPLTRLCRDRCHYCTFATVPHRLESLFLERDEVVEIARQGAEQGCKEALFTLGDRPEDRWPQAREWLEERGYDSTLDYVRACAIAVLEETGLLPHLNPGVMSWEEATRLKPVAASMGMMLETTSQRLFEKGGPHFGSPDKEPAVRLRALTDAGRVGVPFTTGLLIGIGENRTERAESLFAIRSAARQHGHVQEVIVQNFRAKPDTAMANDPDADLDDLAATLAVARLVLGPKIRLQAPPNLVGEEQALMLRAGIDDWGGVSPVTVDHVSPEMPWPAVEDLERVTAAEGFTLAERLTAYPKYVRAGSPWIDTRLHGHVAALATADGLADPDAVVEGRSWQEPDGGFASTGRTDLNTAVDTEGRTADRRSDFGSVYGDWDEVAAELAAQRSRGGGAGHPAGGGPRLDADARAGLDLAASDPAALLDPANEAAAMAVLTADGPALGELVRLADDVRRDVNGDDVTYVVNRNINFSNVCYVGCRFCAFAQRERDADAFRLSLDDVAARAAEAARDGATEVCVQGGIDPQLPVSFYADLVRAVHEAVPGMHVHAFSPMEIVSAAAKAGVSIRDWLAELKEAGLGSIPGTAAEILDDEVRWVLTKGKLPASQWIEVVSTAHELGIPSSSTMMYGHVDEPRHWLGHLRTLASIQDRSLAAGAAAFTEFVPLPFVHHNAPIYLAGIARPGPTERDNRAVHAFARLALHGRIDHVQVSWVKLGDELAGDVLGGGADDMGGTLMEETISRMAGSENGSERSVEELTAIAHAAGRPVRQRTTTYRGEPSVLTPSRPPTLPLTPA